ncbi:MAG: hypothetical protein K2P78_02580 [Gemmataceae bacterium]|nr:hypothetical protein [Gemmataceae bacterium]
MLIAATARMPGQDKRDPKPKGSATPFLEVGPTVAVRSGVQPIPGQCTTLSAFGVKELRVGLVQVRGGEDTVVEERSYEWAAGPAIPPGPGPGDPAGAKVHGVVQLQFLKGEKGQFSLAFGAGFEGTTGWGYTHKPKDVSVGGTPS